MSRPDDNRLPVFNDLAADQKTTADRKWSAPLKPPAVQKPCDVGLFSDDANQGEMFK